MTRGLPTRINHKLLSTRPSQRPHKQQAWQTFSGAEMRQKFSLSKNNHNQDYKYHLWLRIKQVSRLHLTIILNNKAIPGAIPETNPETASLPAMPSHSVLPMILKKVNGWAGHRSPDSRMLPALSSGKAATGADAWWCCAYIEIMASPWFPPLAAHAPHEAFQFFDPLWPSKLETPRM